MTRNKKLLLIFVFLFSWGAGLLLLDAAKEYIKKEYTLSEQNPALEYLKEIGKTPPSIKQRDALIKYVAVLKGFDELFFKYKVWLSIGVLTLYIALLLLSRASSQHEQKERNNRRRYE
ncbi:hypothetical protein DNJ95_00360 [Stutzerimonas kirkiae]|uniref:Uncharacterized protein n=1 Tax=Stutzerimonas kirkiae TaxID=2211392 RepID=A0A4Q9RDD1_9GAMM|nr:hypothetical protein [Stutzerimonas kirkiae]TBU99371.1 hypothetical protein DNJ96_03440 [Stutzerimonas kirkiae]TBV06169.1 hypothetical protein DNJ95_00360 [Stutzerimonas kirkiae]